MAMLPREKQANWYASVLGTGTALVFVVIGTTIALAPFKMVKTLSLVRKPSSTLVRGLERPFLRFQMKSPLPIPFIKPLRNGRTIDAPLHDVFVDRQVAAQRLDGWTAPLSRAADFTASDSSAIRPSRPSVLSRLKAFNRSVIDIWPVMKQDVRRMFLRDGMAYIRIVGQDGQWKLDLEMCQLLDDGKPLDQVMVPESRERGGWVQWLRTLLS